MNLKRYLLVSVLGLSITACSNKDDVPGNGTLEGVSTYATLSIYLPGVTPTKALPEDYNPDGVYEGRDAVETLDIYMIGTGGSFEPLRFTGDDISTDGSTVSLSQPFRTTSGNKTIYVVINDPNPARTTAPSDDDLIDINGLATRVTVNGEEYDDIMMTGKTNGTVAVEPDISQQAVIGGANHFNIEVTRIASRVIVTTTASTTLTNSNGDILGILSDINYSVAQGTNEVYFMPRTDYTTWGSDYVPTTENEYISQATQYYDYSDLDNGAPVPLLPAAGDGYKSLAGKFLFENTHTAGPDARTSQYKKGNTAYVLVRATLIPSTSAIADGGPLTNGTFYVGQSDGLIYSTKQAAQDAVQNQKVAVYQQGRMLYYAWLNPDDINAPMNSPVVRNNIYHINITGFGNIGYNWNPLYPEDPDNPEENPDPKPINPDEPDPPVDPTDPLTPEQTYMTVEVTVLDWTVHSYDIEF